MKAEACLKYQDGLLGKRIPCTFRIKHYKGTATIMFGGFSAEAEGRSDSIVILDEGRVVGEFTLGELRGCPLTTLRKGDTLYFEDI